MEMKLSQSGAYIVDDTGHIVDAREIMAELERLRRLLKDWQPHEDPRRTAYVESLHTQRDEALAKLAELQEELGPEFDAVFYRRRMREVK